MQGEQKMTMSMKKKEEMLVPSLKDFNLKTAHSMGDEMFAFLIKRKYF